VTGRAAEPRRRAAATTVSFLLSLALGVAGVLLALDAVLPATTAHDSALPPLLADLDGLTASAATTAAGAGVVLVGAVLVLSALVPRRRTHLRLRSEADAWITPRAAAALAVRSASRHPGVVGADAERIARRRIVVGVTRDSERSDDAADVLQESLRAELARLPATTTVEVRSRVAP